jgi:septum formation protein
LSSAGPTTVRHANATFSGVSGAFLTIAASAPGIMSCNDTTMPTIACTNPKTQIPNPKKDPRTQEPNYISLMLILASGSPRRAHLLWAAGIAYEAVPADIDETLLEGEQAEPYVRRLSATKARTVASKRPGTAVLGADTVVIADRQILGKPRDGEHARQMLRMLSGRWHEVMTGVTLVLPDHEFSEVVVTRVEFAPLSHEEIEWYVASGEPLDKAAYGVQSLGSRYVVSVDGSYTNVVGLPIPEVYQMCTRAGILLS